MSFSLSNGIDEQLHYSEELSIIFIGKELFYSNQTLRSVQNEFGVEAMRFDALDTLLSGEADFNAYGQIVVVDQMMLEDLLNRPEDYLQVAASGCLAFAYRKESSARFLFEHWDRARFGDIGYLPMNVAPDVWRSILRLLMHEELHLPCFLVDCLPAASNAPERPSPQPKPTPARLSQKMPLYSKLTKREKQVLRLVSQGESNKTIASKLGITEHTVKLHMHNVSGKIGVRNRTAAAHFYFEVAPNDTRGPSLD